MTVTVANYQGQFGTLSTTIRVLSTVLGNATLAFGNFTAGQLGKISVKVPGIPSSDLPYLNATWSWGGGYAPFPFVENGTWGPTTGHTYLLAGSYTAKVNLTYPGLSMVSISATVKVVDPAPWISLPWQSALIYGVNHTATLNATGLGTWGDLIPNSHSWKFTWAYGDGSAVKNTTSTTGYTEVNHTYTQGGYALLNLTATTPQATAYKASATFSAYLNLVPDSDGDGLPNAYEAFITHTSPWQSHTNQTGYGEYYGTGFTDYLTALFDGLLSNLTADSDGDGLTNAQEVFATVTGFPSNPLDANTAGDGLPDGAHFFTDHFASSNVTSFNATNWTVDVTIPNVWYGGSAIGFNQSRLTLELSMDGATKVRGSFGNPVLYLGSPSSSQGIYLPKPTNVTNTYYLLNDSPQGGQTGSYVFSLSSLETEENWTVQISFTNSSGGSGNITEAMVADSYYMNPSLADPTYSGMLDGSTVTTPIYNCSAPTNETFPVLDWAHFKVNEVAYWPYTETYYKLSRMQGVPYILGSNGSETAGNNATTCGNHVASGHYKETASYLGAADFGISPWNAHAAGAAVLTNGMKALGATNYTDTAWQYEQNGSGLMATLSYPIPYPSDPLSGVYSGPLSPTDGSTAQDGVGDAVSKSPAQPLALEVKVNWAIDPNCTDPSSATPVQVGITVEDSPYPSTLYTPDDTSASSAGAACAYGTIPGDNSGSTYDYYDDYTIPLNVSRSTFTVAFTVDATGGFGGYAQDVDQTLSGTSSSLYAWVNSASGTYVNASVRVVPLNRTQVILYNTTEELKNLPHYGYRYVGEPQFYELYVKSNGAYGPFAQGENVVLESRKAFLDAPINGTLIGANYHNPFGTCFGNDSVGVRNVSGTPTGIAGSFDLYVGNATCAANLEKQLSSTNGTRGVIGQNRTLSTLQFNLLGLGSLVDEPVAYAVEAGYNSSTGPDPGTSSYGGYVVNSLDALGAYAWVALVGLGTLFYEGLVYLGQLFFHAASKAANAVANAVKEAASAFNALLAYVIALGESLASVALSPIYNGIVAYDLSIRYSLWNNVLTIRNNRQINASESEPLWSNMSDGAGSLAMGLGVALQVVSVAVAVFGFGVGFLVTFGIGYVAQAAAAHTKSAHALPGLTSTTGYGTLVLAVEAAVNGTAGPPSGSGSPNNPSQKEAYAVAGQDANNLPLDVVLGVGLGMGFVAAELSGKNAELAAGFAFGLGVIGLMLDYELYSSHQYCGYSPFDLVLSLLGFALAADGYDQAEGFIEDGALAFTAAASVGALYEYSRGC